MKNFDLTEYRQLLDDLAVHIYNDILSAINETIQGYIGMFFGIVLMCGHNDGDVAAGDDGGDHDNNGSCGNNTGDNYHLIFFSSARFTRI